ncbi:MAG: amidohydrolase family protein [Nocardiopsaceae bacterium]|nr:amidohydrolase family protein [Nocardiopsaceae bacterium]
MGEWDIVLRGGRIIDPESGLDAVGDVAIVGDRIAAIALASGVGGTTGHGGTGGGTATDRGTTGDGSITGNNTIAGNGGITGYGGRLGRGRVELDVSGQVVTAGFVDIHSHCYDTGGLRLQAMDGVTTALELESGVTPASSAYAGAAAAGRPVNYGFAASWAMARMSVLTGVALDGSLRTFFRNSSRPEWQRAADRGEQERILSLLEADLADGALGIGVLAGYAPTADPEEYLRVAALAARAGVPTYTHSRDLVEFRPQTLVDGAEEIVRAAGETGAHMHYCHVNSTTLRHADRVLGLVERAQAAGARVTTEAYPYGAGMTGIGAAFLAPERLHERGLVPSDLTYAPTGEQVADAARLAELRAADPGGLAIIRNLDESDAGDRALLMRYLLFPGTVVASDAMPLTWAGVAPGGGTPGDGAPGGGSPQGGTPGPEAPAPEAWPLPPEAFGHPRTAGTFSRAVRMLTRDGGELSLAEALAKCSLHPARLLESRVPAMRRKGRLAPGADADVVVFDPEVISDQATYAASTRPSAGIRHVLVNGTLVVRDGRLATAARPGRPIRSAPA